MVVHQGRCDGEIDKFYFVTVELLDGLIHFPDRLNPHLESKTINYLKKKTIYKKSGKNSQNPTGIRMIWA